MKNDFLKIICLSVKQHFNVLVRMKNHQMLPCIMKRINLMNRLVECYPSECKRLCQYQQFVTNTLHCFEKPPFVMKDHIIVTNNLLILMEMAYTSIKTYLYIARNKKCLGNTLVFFCPLVCQIISFQTTFCCLYCIQFLCL